MIQRTTRVAAALLTAALVTTACGQKPGVHVEDIPGGGQVLAGGSFGQPDTTTAPGTTGTTGTPGSTGTPGTTGSTGVGGAVTGPTGPGAAGGAGGDTTTGDPAQPGDPGQPGEPAPPGGGGGEAPPPGGGEAPPPAAGQRQVTGSDRTGVTDDKITIALHAPVTGAAPIPAESFKEARDLYWLWQTQKKQRSILGRKTVEVVFADDKYSPDNARQVCRQLASSSFIVAGGGGTDQIQACGQLAQVGRFPYFSAGVTEAGLEGNEWYFAASMTYRQQGVLLAQYLKKNFGDKKVAMVVTDTGNFRDAEQGFIEGAQQQGLDFFDGGNARILRHPKGDTSWYSSFAQQLHREGIQVVYILTSPVAYIEFAQQANQSGYGPFQYVGVGVTKALNTVLSNGCPDVNGGIFFSPFPGLDVARQIEPEFFQAAQEYGKVADDLALALWGINKQLDLLWQRYEQTFGTDLTREDFRALVENTQGLETNLFPRVSYTPQDHFGGEQVHVLQADCGKKEHVTLASFASGF
jgi:branched-chain amino acid transport system substrate-binding protein